ncbi:hypothetical protein G3480_18455 [Thiorhodococcus mannitoliphagus]|uniref:Uncharacterized protein n=1 Tax=Thiorhodococcus mannitoliphagus TaxID=329406 RepID=A0A6P1DYW0_9GAMM|nr:hypothetical protein [Thiorhodococcus mannitoliphagus]NEX22263.1 hypothetical protein [Thiorhodococcus mannitoliphagus]
MHISEADWKVYKRLRDLAQERYSQRLLDEAERLCRDTSLSVEDRHLALSRLVRARDQEMVHIFDTLRRSSAVLCVMMMRSHNLVTDAEMQTFSPELQRASAAPSSE